MWHQLIEQPMLVLKQLRHRCINQMPKDLERANFSTIGAQGRSIPNHTSNDVYLGHNQEGFFEDEYMT